MEAARKIHAQTYRFYRGADLKKEECKVFLKMSGFKELIKNAWKGGGLVVGNDGEGIYLYGRYWTIYLERTMIPKKAKAAIMELTGELPEPGQVFKSWQNQENQYELKESYLSESYCPDVYTMKTWYKTTGVVFKEFGQHDRVLQDKKSLTCILIPAHIYDMIDRSSMEKGEYDPEGPAGKYDGTSERNMIYWQNDACTLGVATCVVTADSKQKFLLDHMKHYDYTKGEKAK